MRRFDVPAVQDLLFEVNGLMNLSSEFQMTQFAVSDRFNQYDVTDSWNNKEILIDTFKGFKKIRACGQL